MYNNHIYEPVKEYDSKYRSLHAKNVSDYFEDLVKTSGVNEEENKETVKEIKKLKKDIKDVTENIKKYKGLRTFLVILIVISFIAGIFMFVNIYNEDYMVNLVSDIFITIGTVLLGVGFIFLISKKINVILKEAQKTHEELKEKLKVELIKAEEQMRPLNELYDWGMPQELASKTFPSLILDPYFDSKRYDFLYSRFNLIDNEDINTSVTYVQSGEMSGNPFVMGKMVNHRMVDYTYSGQLTISWTETVSTGKGQYKTVTKSEILTAYLTKPKPGYFGKSFLMYGNDAAPDLSFSRESKKSDKLSEKQISKKVSKGAKKLEKKSRQSVRKGGSFTTMANADFDVLFGATNRDHEVQYRLLFTPLAQKEMLNILLENEIGFGDDFDFIKQKKLNIIIPEHLEKADINSDPNRYVHYDLETSRKIFNNYNNSYFKSVYFTFAPIFAIPLYQQYKPKEFIYKDKYESNVSSWEHEAVANSFSQNVLKHPASVTYNMIKTRLIKSTEGADEVKVTSYGYESFKEVSYVKVYGGDGRYHNVPVVWYRYEPVDKETNIVIKTADTLKRNEYIKNVLNNQNWQEYLNNNLSEAKEVNYRRNIIAYTSKEDVGLKSIKDLKKILDR